MYKVSNFINRNIINLTKCKVLMTRTLCTNVHPNILLSDSNNVDIPDITIPEFILPKLEKYDRFTAIECATTARSYTFGQIRDKCRKLSKSLRHVFKLKKGDVIALLLPNRPEFVISTLGIFEAGLVLTTLNPLYTPEEISRQLLDSSAKVIITLTQSVSNIQSALKLLKQNIPIIAIKNTQSDSFIQGVVDFEELVNAKIDIPDADFGKPEDLLFLPYSSGTTGLPKGVELSHRNLVANLCQITHDDYNYYDTPSDSFQDVVPAALPFFHIYGFNLTLLLLAYNGAKSVSMEKFSPDLYISVLKKHPVSIIYGAPPLVLFLTAHPGVKPEYLKNIKMITSGAAPLGFLDEERMLAKLGQNARIIQGLGMTETSPIIAYSPKNMRRSEENAGSVGRPIPNTMIKMVALDDPTGTPLGPNKEGEIFIKGPQVMAGYHKREEETKNAFVDGWLRSGDVGYYNDEKLIYVTDRIKELIKVKGFQVAPAELEEIIRNHPSIEDAAVIGIPHPRYGEVPRAYVVLKKNSSLDVENLKNHLSERVANYKRLEGGVRIVESIPKNPSGKILRRQLKVSYEEKGI